MTLDPAVGVTWKLGSETVLVFGPESVSYERSRRENRAKFHEISARVFFEKISKSQDSMIYTILRFFWILILKMGSLTKCLSHPTRPPGRPAGRPAGRPPVRLGSILDQNELISSISQFNTGSE